MDSTSRFHTCENYILRNIAGEYVLISVGANIADFNGYIKLNETAAFLWDVMQEPKNVEELTALLQSEFEVSEEEAQNDVRDFLELMLRETMVIRV